MESRSAAGFAVIWGASKLVLEVRAVSKDSRCSPITGQRTSSTSYPGDFDQAFGERVAMKNQQLLADN